MDFTFYVLYYLLSCLFFWFVACLFGISVLAIVDYACGFTLVWVWFCLGLCIILFFSLVDYCLLGLLDCLLFGWLFVVLVVRVSLLGVFLWFDALVGLFMFGV